MADDFLSGFAILAVALITIFFDWHYLDGLAAIFIGLIVLKGISKVVKESIEILMEATPKHLNINELKKAIKTNDGVEGVHDLHAWTLGSNIYCLSAHIQVKDANLSTHSNLITNIKQMLAEKFEITHTTIELECTDCEIKNF